MRIGNKIGILFGLLLAGGVAAAERIVIPAAENPARASATGTGVQIDYPFLGFSEAMSDPALFDELAAAVRELGVKTLRFPGGCAAYAYSTTGPESLDPYRDVYYACNSTISKWADFRDFFRLCQATGCQAIYQLNIGNYFDPERGEVFAIAPRDSGLIYGAAPEAQQLKLAEPKPANYDFAMLERAAAEAGLVARTAREMGVEVIWEFGNEDYCFYAPDTYVEVVKPFYAAILNEDPHARFMVCADGISWGDWSWPRMVFQLLKAANLPVDYASFHVYVTGGGGGSFANGADSYESVIRSWNNIRHLHSGMRSYLDEIGFSDTAAAITEGNIASGEPMVGQPYEHGMGRALGEAAIYPDRVSRYAFLVHHDLVRSGPSQGTWYCRIFYDPAQPAGARYFIPVAARVMGRMAAHAGREFLYDDGRGIAVSAGAADWYFTAGNPTAEPRALELVSTLPLRAGRYEAESVTAADMDTPQWNAVKTPFEVDSNSGATVRITLPPYSFTWFSLAK